MHSTIQHYLQTLAIDRQLTGLDLVTQIIKRHLATLPFSSINPLLKQPLSLELNQIGQRLLTDKTGGYCYEHHKLLFEALEHLGFEVQRLNARVLLKSDNGPRTHRTTLLHWQGQQWLLDVGFGISTPRIPIPLNGESVHDNDRRYFVEPSAHNGFTLMWQHDDQDAQPLYRFDLAEVTEADYQMGHFYCSQYPESAFTQHLVVSKLTHHHRYLLRHLAFSQTDLRTGIEEECNITDAEQLRQALKQSFDLHVSKEQAKALFVSQYRME